MFFVSVSSMGLKSRYYCTFFGIIYQKNCLQNQHESPIVQLQFLSNTISILPFSPYESTYLVSIAGFYYL